MPLERQGPALELGRRLLELDGTTPPALAVALDEVIGADVGAARAAPTLRVWECGAAVVVPRRFLRSDPPTTADASPVCGRASGGAAVALGPGVVCVSLVLPLDAGTPTIEQAYRLWLDGVARGLGAAYGVSVTHDSIHGVFCDGRYNAVVGGRKLAGTAQSRRNGSVVVHGCLLVDVDPAGYCGRLAGVADTSSTDRAEELITTLRAEAGREIDRLELAEAVAEGLAAVGVGCPEPGWDVPRPDEWARARELVS